MIGTFAYSIIFINTLGMILKNVSKTGTARPINGIIQYKKKGIQIAKFAECIFTVTSIVIAAENKLVYWHADF